MIRDKMIVRNYGRNDTRFLEDRSNRVGNWPSEKEVVTRVEIIGVISSGPPSVS
jgi:hypothetical protein